MYYKLPWNGKELALLGLPFDFFSTFYGSSKKSPKLIREHLYNMFWEVGGKNIKDIVSDFGDLENLEDLDCFVEKRVEEGFKGVSFLGGDHGTTYFSVKAVKKHYGIDHLIVFDAHLDLLPRELNHQSYLYHLLKEGVVEKITILGAREYVEDELEVVEENKDVIDFYYSIEPFLEKMQEEEEKIYISVDLDVLKPIYAIGTNSPELGGYEIEDVLKIVEINKKVVGFDIVELADNKPGSDLLAFVASRIYKEFAFGFFS